MSERLLSIRRLLTRRRRRSWRYVSPGRRGTALVVLALLSLAVYGYWFLTNGRQVRRTVETYLTELTGAKVHVGQARFSMFGPIELGDVVVRLPGRDAGEPLFRAARVVIPHNPWRLLLTGQVQPTEIVFIKPVVNLERYGGDTSNSNVTRMTELAQEKRSHNPASGVVLPPICLREGRLCVTDIDKGVRRPRKPVPLNMSMVPYAADQYQVRFEEVALAGEPIINGSLVINLATGEVKDFQGIFPIRNIRSALPAWAVSWVERYSVEGDLRITGPSSGPTGQEVFRIEFENTSLRLPDDEGGLGFDDVHGAVRLESSLRMVEIEKIEGRVAGSTGGAFSMGGFISGEGDARRIHVELAGRDVVLPEAVGDGELARKLREIRETFHPVGKADVSAVLDKLPGGDLAFSGAVEMKGMSAVWRVFPYPLEGVTGRVAFDAHGVRLTDIRGHNGPAKLLIGGRVGVDGSCDVLAQAENLPVDERLKAAMLPGMQSAWNDLLPEGVSRVNVRVTCGHGVGPETITLTLLDPGAPGMTVSSKFFPYRVNIRGGTVIICGDDVTIPAPTAATSAPAGEPAPGPICGSSGSAEFSLCGTLADVGTDHLDIDVIVRADRVPLDDVLMGALSPAAQDGLRKMNATGRARDITTRITQKPNGPVDYRVEARLEDIAYCYSGFPYAVSEASGDVLIQADGMTFTRIAGRHGRASISIDGRVLFDNSGGCDLTISARDFVMDKELHDALPKDAQQLWQTVLPTGLADVAVTKCQINTPDNPGKQDYRIEIIPRDMTFTYAGFPYTFRIGQARVDGAKDDGKIILTPDVVEFAGLKAHPQAKGPTLRRLDGKIVAGPKEQQARLSLSASGLTLDAEHLKALPKDEIPLLAKLFVGGELDLNVRELYIARPADAATTMPTTASTQPAGSSTRPAGQWAWRLAGQMTLRDAKLDLGFGAARIDGVFDGEIERSQRGLAVDAKLSDVTVSGVDAGATGEVTAVAAKLSMLPGGPLRIADFSGKAYGGRVEGEGLLQVNAPLRYRLRASFEALQLEHLMGAAAGAGMKGLLDGNVELSATAGDPASNEASGALRITQANSDKLPVLLGVLQVLPLSIPGGGGVGEAFVEYHVKGQSVVFNEIHTSGAGVGLVGSGKMDLKTRKIAMTFLRAESGVLPRLSGLDELLRGILREIAEVRVSGTLEKPEVQTIGLRSLQGLIDTIMHPEQAKL